MGFQGCRIACTWVSIQRAGRIWRGKRNIAPTPNKIFLKEKSKTKILRKKGKKENLEPPKVNKKTNKKIKEKEK